MDIQLNDKDKGLKYDIGKPMFDLIDPIAQEGLARVLTFGAKKYSAHNWRKGIEYSRLIAAIKRHLNAIERGELIDPDSGELHIDNIQCNAMFLSNFMHTERNELNDLYWNK